MTLRSTSTNESATSTAPLEQLLEAIRQRRDEFGVLQEVPVEIMGQMKEAGLFRMLVPRRFGGDEASLIEFFEIVEQVSIVDGSAGWVAGFAHMPTYVAAALSLEVQAEIYANGPDVIFAGGFYPPQPAEVVEGGLKVLGRWGFGSGSLHADYIGVGALPMQDGRVGGPLYAMMPRDKVTIERNWDVVGLRGTGSHTLVVEDVFVPWSWTFERGETGEIGTPLYRYPPIELGTQSLAIVGLGLARAALDAVIAQACYRASRTGAPLLAERPYAQIEIAKAEAELRAARAFFFEVTRDAYDWLEHNEGPIPPFQTNVMRLASLQAGRISRKIVAQVFTLAGTTALWRDQPYARMLLDGMSVPQQFTLNEGNWQSAGKAILYREDETGST